MQRNKTQQPQISNTVTIVHVDDAEIIRLGLWCSTPLSTILKLYKTNIKDCNAFDMLYHNKATKLT